MIGMWKGKFGQYLGHSKGLTKEQIDFLKSLSEGDRLIMYVNEEKRSEYSPDVTIKVYQKKEESSEESL